MTHLYVNDDKESPAGSDTTLRDAPCRWVFRVTARLPEDAGRVVDARLTHIPAVEEDRWMVLT